MLIEASTEKIQHVTATRHPDEDCPYFLKLFNTNYEESMIAHPFEVTLPSRPSLTQQSAGPQINVSRRLRYLPLKDYAGILPRSLLVNHGRSTFSRH